MSTLVSSNPRGHQSLWATDSGHQDPQRAVGNVPTRPQLRLVPAYTILVSDTNILLSLPVTMLVKSMRWTAVVPLPAS